MRVSPLFLVAALSAGFALACAGGKHEGNKSGECSDGADNDDDGLFDCDDDDCDGSSDCGAEDTGSGPIATCDDGNFPSGVTFVDAPLTRTPAAAEAGTANTMVGADAATFERLRPVFEAYCEHIIHAGPPGHGLVLKLINNMVGQAITTATAEGLAAAAKAGLDLRPLHKLMSLGSVNNLMFQFMLVCGGCRRLRAGA